MCIRIVINFSGDDCNPPRENKNTKDVQNFGWEASKVYCGSCANDKLENRSPRENSRENRFWAGDLLGMS